MGQSYKPDLGISKCFFEKNDGSTLALQQISKKCFA
jgi:hypothetical protein